MNLIFKVVVFFLITATFLFPQQNKSPKNIIILIGDGMGVNYISASVLSDLNSPFKKFPVVGFSVTCAVDKLITDSAAGGTALATGYNTKYGFISVDSSGKWLPTIFEIAKKKNKATGFVVTSSITNATPAVFFAHVNDRHNEKEIAKQITEANLDIAIGGGKKFFYQTFNDSTKNESNYLLKKLEDKKYSIFFNYDSLKRSNDKKIFALLDESGLKPSSERNYSLKDLTSLAIKSLSKNKYGFVLMIEGSQIDWAGHSNNQDYLLSEMKEFSDAIAEVLNFAEKDKNTLVVLTSDHETGGMAIVDGNVNGNNLKLKFLTKEHTAGMVGVFAFGVGNQLFSGMNYNYQIGRKLLNLLEPKYNFATKNKNQ